MAGTYHHQAIQSGGVETSVDLARKHKFHTTILAGRKRPLEDVESARPQSRAFLPPPRLKASSIISVPSQDGLEKAPQISDYSQRKDLASTPGPSQNPLLSLKDPRYGLPEQLASNFESLGVRSIYPWQSSCLLGKGLLSGETNLIYTAPTGGGKSLVADVLLLKRIIQDPGKKAILVLPYVALVHEKLRWLRKVVDGVTKDIELEPGQDAVPNLSSKWRLPHRHIRVAGFYGGSTARSTWADIDIAICTIEKVGGGTFQVLELT